MKIGIITFHRAENYGSALQAYALNRYLGESFPAHTIETIDYSNEAQRRIYRLFQPVRSLMDMARAAHTLLYVNALKKRKSRFRSFVEQELKLSDFHGSDISELSDYARKYDAVICGSDQIWNVRCWDFDPCYMLSFVANAQKIAYAPSLGLSSFTDGEEKIYRRYLPSFASLSTREEEGATWLSDLLNRHIETVADPVFLLSADQWLSLSNRPRIEGRYVLCYFIGSIPGMREFARKVRRQTGIEQVVVVMKNLRDLFSGYVCKFDNGPREFVGLIAQAELVITDSFHAVAFSLLFHRKFWVFVASGEDASTKPNSRIRNILGKTGLTSRMLDQSRWEAYDPSVPIDFEQSDAALKLYIDVSKEYLRKSICNVEE